MALSSRDEPGTQREYETIFILRPDTNQDGIQLPSPVSRSLRPVTSARSVMHRVSLAPPDTSVEGAMLLAIETGFPAQLVGRV